MITTQSAKLSCIDDFYNKNRLIMQEDKCKSCDCFYTCPFILASYNEVVEGD